MFGYLNVNGETIVGQPTNPLIIFDIPHRGYEPYRETVSDLNLLGLPGDVSALFDMGLSGINEIGRSSYKLPQFVNKLLTVSGDFGDEDIDISLMYETLLVGVEMVYYDMVDLIYFHKLNNKRFHIKTVTEAGIYLEVL
jgi:hypothetical protein